jgi:outer membrane protein assembly factor BamB
MKVLLRRTFYTACVVLFAACGKTPDPKGEELTGPLQESGPEEFVSDVPREDAEEKGHLPSEFLQDRGGAERSGHIEGPAPIFPLRVVKEWKGKSALRAPVTVTSELMFFSGTDGRTVCLRRGGGDHLWSFQAGSPVFAAGAYEDGFFFSTDTGGRVYALDALTGTPKWTAETGGRIIAAPLLYEDRIIVGNEKGVLSAFDQKDGIPVWTQFFAHSIYAPPSAGAGAVYIGTEGGVAAAVSIADGSILWQGNVDGPVFGSLVFYGDVLVGGTLSGGYFALDAKTGSRIWEQKTQASFFASPAVKDGFAVFGDLGGSLFSVDLRSGLLRWRVSLFEPIALSPLFVDGRILAATEDSFLYLLDEFSGETAGRTGVPGRITSGPVSLDGVLYLGTAEGRLLIMEGTPAVKAGSPQTAVKPIFDSYPNLPSDGKETEVFLSSTGQNIRFAPSPGGVYYIEVPEEPLRAVAVKLIDQDGAEIESNFEYSAMTRGFSYRFDSSHQYILRIEPLHQEEGLFSVRIRARFISAKP